MRRYGTGPATPVVMIPASLRGVSPLLILLSGAMACTATAIGTGEDKSVAVFDVTPREGDYGTTITVTGQNLGEQGVFGVDPSGERVQILAPPVPTKAPTKTSVDAGADAPPPGSSLTFRFPFPAEGEMTLTGQGGEISIGTFTPTFTPGRPLPFERGSEVLGAAALGTDTAVLVKRSSGLAFVVFGAGEPRTVDVEGGTSAAVEAWVRDAGGAVEAFVETDSEPELLTFDGTRASATKYVGLDGSYLGAGIDDTGFVIVMQGAGGIVRYRGAPDAPEADGPGVPVPTWDAHAKLAVSGDGTVVRAWTSDAGNAFDDMVGFNMAGLGPRDQAFSAGVSLGSLDDTFKSLDMRVESGVVKLSYCATNTGFGSPSTPCGDAATVDGRSKLNVASAQALAYAAGRVTAASCQADGIVLGSGSPDTELALDANATALYPCSAAKIERLVAGPSGTRLVVTRDGKLYVARRR